MPGRHRKRPAPILPAAVGMALSAATLMTTAAGGPVPVSLTATPAGLFAHGQDVGRVASAAPVLVPGLQASAPSSVAPQAGGTSQGAAWVEDRGALNVLRRHRPVVRPEPAVAPSTPPAAGTPVAVSQPTSAPLARKAPQKAPEARKVAVTSTPAAALVSASSGVSCRAPWLSGVKHVAQVVGCDISQRFGITNIGGYRAGSREHGSGKALDFMVGGDVAKGNAIVEYVLANWDRLGVQHIIWRQYINYGSGWKKMPDRGSATANHEDHPHLLLK